MNEAIEFGMYLLGEDSPEVIEQMYEYWKNFKRHMDVGYDSKGIFNTIKS